MPDGNDGTLDGHDGTLDGDEGTFDGDEGTLDGDEGTLDGDEGTLDGGGAWPACSVGSGFGGLGLVADRGVAEGECLAVLTVGCQ